MNQKNFHNGRRDCVVYSVIEDKGIFIKNIYYMLAYAFREFQEENYESVAAEQFEMVQDLLASLLAKGVVKQLKKGLYREYMMQHGMMSTLRGKIDMQETIRERMHQRRRLVCEYDELSENNRYNQILKTTMHYLIRDKGVSRAHKTELHKAILFFDGVDLLNPSAIEWGRLRYQRSNKSYEALLNICYLVLEGMLQTTERGNYKMRMVSDEHMARLYEKFILAYYRRHHTYLTEVKAAQIPWNLTEIPTETSFSKLPVMQSDAFLRFGDKILIIDAKYYGKIMQSYYDKHTLHSANLYQIYTYVKNQDTGRTGNVAGMLVYAKTQEADLPDSRYSMDGNRIGATTLDLNREFEGIAHQLDDIAAEFFGKQPLTS